MVNQNNENQAGGKVYSFSQAAKIWNRDTSVILDLLQKMNIEPVHHYDVCPDFFIQEGYCLVKKENLMYDEFTSAEEVEVVYFTEKAVQAFGELLRKKAVVTYTVGDAAQKSSVSAIKLKRKLRQHEILRWVTESHNGKQIPVERIMRQYKAAGYFKCEDEWYGDHLKEKIYVTEKGIDFIKSLLNEK